MGFLGLKRLMSMRRERKRRRRQIQARNGSIASIPQKKDSLCLEGHPHGGKRSRHSGPNLSEDIWFHIHSLVPIRYAARSASVSRMFLRSWRSRPKLTLSKETLGVKRNGRGKGDVARCFTSRVDQILKNHSGIGVKTLELEIPYYCNVNDCHLNSWLQIAITPGIEEVTLLRHDAKAEYKFPCSLLFAGRGSSIRFLYLLNCAFHPPVGFDCLRSLTKLYLSEVRITDDELGCLISKCFALEQLQLRECSDLICLKIPFCLERLSFLSVQDCDMLEVIESKAPNLSTIRLYCDPIHLSFGESSQVNYLRFGFSTCKPNCFSYAITKLPSAVPSLETLVITSINERVNTPMVADKFVNLKYLDIYLSGDSKAFYPAYDYLSLVSFLNASPVLETFILHNDVKNESVFEDVSNLRRMLGHEHNMLKEVQINGFCSAKSMVELTCHILENATSLEILTVDTLNNDYNEGVDGNISRCCAHNTYDITRDMILEAHRALNVFKKYVLGRVPSTVKLNLGELCSRCHAVDTKLS
ncbi:hypothetical protein ACP4OV_025745 [Aristida adscensionis]